MSESEALKSDRSTVPALGHHLEIKVRKGVPHKTAYTLRDLVVTVDGIELTTRGGIKFIATADSINELATSLVITSVDLDAQVVLIPDPDELDYEADKRLVQIRNRARRKVFEMHSQGEDASEWLSLLASAGEDMDALKAELDEGGK